MSGVTLQFQNRSGYTRLTLCQLEVVGLDRVRLLESYGAVWETRMTRVKMVRCKLRAPGEAPAPRFIPLREFKLWKYYMTHAHDKIVESEEISIWVEADTYEEEPPTDSRPLEAVLRVNLQYWDRGINTATHIQRYFLLEDYDTIRDVFLSHFPDHPGADGRAFATKRLTETRGYYLLPRVHQPLEA